MYQVISIFLAEPPQNILYGYGPLGIGVVVMSAVIYKMFKIILDDRDKAVQQRDTLLEDYLTKVLPAITKNTEVLASRQDLDREIILLLGESNAAVKENTRVMEDVKRVVRMGGGHGQTGGT